MTFCIHLSFLSLFAVQLLSAPWTLRQQWGFCMVKQNWSNGQYWWVLGTALTYRLFIIFPSPEPCSEGTSQPHSTPAAGGHLLQSNHWEQLHLLLSGYSQSLRFTQQKTFFCKRSLVLQHKGGFSLAERARKPAIQVGIKRKKKIRKIWQEASLVSLSISKFVLFSQECIH